MSQCQENSESASYTPSLCAHDQISNIKMDPAVSSESQVFLFFSLRMKMKVSFSDCEQPGLWALEASFDSLPTEWFPYNMTRKHLPNKPVYGDQRWSIHWSFKNSAFWILASDTLLELRHTREHLLSRAGVHPSVYPTSLVENCSNCHGSVKLRYKFLLPSFITVFKVLTTGAGFK